MRKRFNVTGLCYPDKHYMVDLTSRLEEIKQLIEYGEYFIINRARQYGKTTTLRALRQYLNKEYAVISLSFQGMSQEDFRDEFVFTRAFAKAFVEAACNKKVNVQGLAAEQLYNLRQGYSADSVTMGLKDLYENLSSLCETADKPVVLMIDEVDSASNNQVFLDFLGILRDYYLKREDVAIFQSVVLAGVYDIKNLKQKIRPEQEHKYNSPWNIAADFEIDMSFSALDIAGMLKEYEKDNHTGMDIMSVAEQIFSYTSGYPYLVSRICKIIDEKLAKNLSVSAWSLQGVTDAVKELLGESNTLFDDMRKKITEYSELRDMIYAILFTGQSIPFNPDNYAIDIGAMFGFLKKENGNVAIANRIFETRLYNLFMSEELINNITYKASLQNRSQFINGDELDMELILKKFVEHFSDIYSDNDQRFLEENGRKLFLLYIKPIINGTGNYYVEAQTRDLTRTDVVIDYLGKQYIIEMKIWRGEEYKRRGEEQLVQYLDYYHLKKGYLLSFNFNQNKQVGVQTVQYGDKTIVEAVV